MSELVLSLFPGIGLLDRAFEDAGFCVVRGPDLLWGGDVGRFHPPAGRFDGVIGGPPCQMFSTMRHVNPAAQGGGAEPKSDPAIRAGGVRSNADVVPHGKRSRSADPRRPGLQRG
jgi:site-specific DNA-cytosine methylase